MAIDFQDPTANPAAPRKVRKAERMLLALQLRKQGMSYRSIAAAISKMSGYSPKYNEKAAYLDVTQSLAQVISERKEIAEQNLRLDLDRYDSMFAKYYEGAMKGDIMAANVCMSILDRRAKVFGFYNTAQQNLNIDVSRLTDEQLERISNGEDPITVLATSNTGAN